MTVKHKELRRLASLDVMGIQSYVSRRQLPGAAITRRLTVVRSPVTTSPPSVLPDASSSRERSPGIARMPQIEATTPAVAPRRAAVAVTQSPTPLRFSLAVVTAGDCLWLEEIDHAAMTAEQLLLLQGMVRALATAAGAGDGKGALPGLEVEYFNWPLHNNRQLDQGEEAARHGVAGFIQRRLELGQCSGLIMLGEACRPRVPLELLDCPRVVSIASTASMLADPLSKKQAWRELRRICPTA